MSPSLLGSIIWLSEECASSSCFCRGLWTPALLSPSLCSPSIVAKPRTQTLKLSLQLNSHMATIPNATGSSARYNLVAAYDSTLLFAWLQPPKLCLSSFFLPGLGVGWPDPHAETLSLSLSPSLSLCSFSWPQGFDTLEKVTTSSCVQQLLPQSKVQAVRPLTSGLQPRSVHSVLVSMIPCHHVDCMYVYMNLLYFCT